MNNRLKDLSKLQDETFDVAIIGGGITGSGIARDAALRGLKTILIEKGDFSSGTSSKSGKLIHGGLRYLKDFHFKMVFESCKERLALMHTVAPHLVKPVEFVLTFYKGNKVPKWLAWMGLLTYDILSLFQNVRMFRNINAKELINLEPFLKQNNSCGALSYYDCMGLDTRLVIDTLKSATDSGAVIFNYLEVINNQYQEDIFTLSTKDKITNQEYKLKAKTIVNATGVWADDFLQKSGINESFNLKMTSGIHLLFTRQKFPLFYTISVESVDDKRPLYFVPWKDFVLVGTTDQYYYDNPDKIKASKSDIEYILKSVNHYFPDLKLTDQDIQGLFCGVRPLIGSDVGVKESKISRDYEIKIDPRGMISITGGKLTTYRSMAKKTVDKLISNFFPTNTTSCKTLSPISGAHIISDFFLKLKEEFQIEDSKIRTLIARYGSNAYKILAPHKSNRPMYDFIHPKINYLVAEIYYMVEHEHVFSLIDLLCRRTTLFFKKPILPLEVLEMLSLVIGKVHQKSAEEIKADIKEYQRFVESEFEMIKTKIDWS